MSAGRNPRGAMQNPRNARRGKPAPPGAALPVRQFDPTVGAITAREHVDDVETEDPALTDYLMRAWLDLIHPGPTPLPSCPRCGGLRVRVDHEKAKSISFFCHHCKRSFNRRTGTPFAGMKDFAKGTAMIPLPAVPPVAPLRGELHRGHRDPAAAAQQHAGGSRVHQPALLRRGTV
ncbi:protein of unknown function (plasmid) [Cupriavidus taiwanensis]|uniref:Transposase n=1 Tax=Cupriavidus taiwanensis TaxID=164546 RepID=A0A7Z7JHC8_9BURK|nr:protein of unknown function [Cupriavidus taiwanensis]SOZ12786.1 protein of unknown function [Cupriavidus taiwanensis]SOZ41278.1 protein of unknown function [Cupriavidus taiwanensis]SPC23540.1 protein of unknown function [Cupriavidus taiwanensis]SPD54835.1 protein of unknown function [Cupriavidus taiwanensis]